MWKPYKMNMTRPEFLSTFLLDDPDEKVYSFEELSRLIPACLDLIYCTYCALIEANIFQSDIEYVNADDEDTVMIKLHKKELAKKIKDTCHKDKVRIGEKIYKLKVDHKNSTIFVSIKLTNPEVLENTIMQVDQYTDPEDFED